MIPKEHINRAGRKKGSKNKSTEAVRTAFELLIQNNVEQLQNDLDDMNPLERFNSVVSLAKIVLPTLKTVDLTANSQPQIQPLFPDVIDYNELKKINDVLESKY